MTARERPAAMSAGSNAAQADVMTGAPTAYAARGWYHTAANPFRFNWPPVPARQFLGERDRAFDPATPTGIIHLDTSDALGTPYPATTPTLLASYVKIRAGERLAGTLISSGEVYYVLSGSGETRNGPDTIAWN